MVCERMKIMTTTNQAEIIKITTSSFKLTIIQTRNLHLVSYGVLRQLQELYRAHYHKQGASIQQALHNLARTKFSITLNVQVKSIL